MSSRIIDTGVGQFSNTNGLGYSFSFATLERSDIQVEVIDPSNNSTTKTVTTHYTIENYSEAGSSNAHIKFVSETARGFTNLQTTYKVKISRLTPSTPKVNFTAGSSITASDLNTQGKQAFHLSEENRDSITSLAAGDATGAIQISGSNIADNSITTSKILDLEVATNDLANLAVTTGKLANDAVNGDKIADNSIDTAHINDSQVTTAKIADDAVTTDKLANSINTSITAASFTTGMIMMFTGNTAPSGWVFCDNSTAAQAAGAPDLRDRFIVGSGSTYSVGNTGGSNSVSLSNDQLPEHRHSFSASNTHRHQQTTYSLLSTGGGGTGGRRKTESTGNTANTTITISGNTGYVGQGDAHENRPPYYALAFIMKL